MPRMHGDRPFGDEEYVREGGVLVPVNTGHEVRHEDGSIAPDDIIEDPIADEGVPGTPDDLPYDYGVQAPHPADQEIGSRERRMSGYGVGHTGFDKDAEEPPLGTPDEQELWRRQRPLIEESGDEAAAESLPDAPEGHSSTGSA